MITIAEVQRIAGEPMTDREASELRDVCYGFAELVFEALKNNQKESIGTEDRGLSIQEGGRSGVLTLFVEAAPVAVRRAN